jgi:CRP-like cAMP-binding protein
VAKGSPESSTLSAGDNFGDEIILDRQKYSSTVVSLETVTGWKINKKVLTETVPIAKLKKML